MTATLDRLGAGVYDHIDEDTYHSDPVPGGSLSSSGARLLLQPGGPAKYRWQADNPPGPKKVFELGSAAHKLVLGAGPELVRIDADEWRTNKIKAEVAEVRERGAIPLKPADWDQIHGMANAIRRHPLAGPLFDPANGEPEKTFIWQDPDTGVWRRSRLDWVPYRTAGRFVVADYKTTTDASPHAAAKAIANHGYFMQDPWYRDAVTAAGLDDDPLFAFCFQEKTPPYLINVVALDPSDVETGRERNRRALDLYATCAATGIWPGYGDEIAPIILPRWTTDAWSATDVITEEIQ
ncbi:PD-(D/E)XK nuclease-like domain-containing protein [Actinomadura sp. ATCC 31491]|uniref:PD-(D/E)XK nuclease-like domain-containing protein n=1 Tax=Actinomadura luzonensis TaxID=2805427 RepID=A0ABT0G561_9ACTN|nr:PD-(D/E)XK nuclease-like domain-containing protein [Actinomadura luzonensis]MCK2219755.1 PD-(D/E)XK nuclease-like domain-containing protein [Actinomadura luzonensis]